MFEVNNFMDSLHNQKLNGFDVMIIQSNENVQLVQKFYKRYQMKLPLDIVLNQLNLTKNDFISSDFKNLTDWVDTLE